MKSTYTVPSSFILVLLAHVGVLAALLYSPQKQVPVLIEPPTIQGVIVASDPIPEPEKPVELPPPPPEKPLPKPKIPLPKAPPSEHAITQDAEPVPSPVPDVEKPVEAAPAPVVPPQADASQLNNPAPSYPQTSRRLKEEGVVLLEILVKADGTLGEMRLKKSSGYARLDEAAQRAVKNWHFLPAKRGGEAIDYWYELPIEFSLNR
ncbi:MAG: energy transducer TonB [Gammaproteobacteria bacterium]|nr:MAG: energy transducer TonB [Gammaproteobacteria bacterium]